MDKDGGRARWVGKEQLNRRTKEKKKQGQYLRKKGKKKECEAGKLDLKVH